MEEDWDAPQQSSGRASSSRDCYSFQRKRARDNAWDNDEKNWDAPELNSGRASSSHDRYRQESKRRCDSPGLYRMQILSHHVRHVIGHGGSKIRQLEVESSCKIQVKRESHNPKYTDVVLIGPQSAQQLAEKLIKDFLSNMDRDQQGNGKEKAEGHRKVGMSTKFDIPFSLVGKIIGKGGEKIRDLQDKSGASLRVVSEQEMAWVEASGDTSQVETARKLVNEIVDPVEAPEQPVATENPTQKKPFQQIDWDHFRQKAEAYHTELWEQHGELKKDFYEEDPVVTIMTKSEVEDFRKQHNNITVGFMPGEGNDRPIPNPVTTFAQAFQNYPELLEELKKQNFAKPSPIQSQSWPVLLQGRDLIGIAQTGTGKTLAFLLPALIHIEGQPIPRSQRKGANVLVLAPTRELALQIHSEVQKINYKGITSVCVYGGGSRAEQINSITKGTEIIIATPGRLNDLVKADIINIHSITYLVLDEADRMLDLGFEPQIKCLLYDIRPDRQTVMTSATWPVLVRELAQKYMKSPVQIHVGSLDLTAVHSVRQIVQIIEEEDKMNLVFKFVGEMSPSDKAILFLGRKARVDHFSSEMAVRGYYVQSIHGGRDQSDREEALEMMRTGEVRVLLATDVASRGIDIKDVTHIVNVDFPHNIEEYVHRIGRTGRAGNTGTAITFMTKYDWANAAELISILKEANQHVPRDLEDMAHRFQNRKPRFTDGRPPRGSRGRRY